MTERHLVQHRSSYGGDTLYDPVTWNIRCTCGWGLRGQTSAARCDEAHAAHVAVTVRLEPEPEPAEPVTVPTRPSSGTQAGDVLKMLEDAGVVCGDAFLRAYMPRYAARILDLRQAGYTINRVPCPYDDHHHSKALATYKLVTG